MKSKKTNRNEIFATDAWDTLGWLKTFLPKIVFAIRVNLCASVANEFLTGVF